MIPILPFPRIINREFEIDSTVMLITSGVGVAVNIVMGATLHQHGHSHGGGGPLGDELHDLLHHVVGEVLGQEVKHEAVGGLEVQVLQVPGVDLSQEDGPAKTINILLIRIRVFLCSQNIITDTSKISGEHYREVSFYTFHGTESDLHKKIRIITWRGRGSSSWRICRQGR